MSFSSIESGSSSALHRRFERVLQSFWLTLAFALAFGFAFQGSRGLWETDEGRYTQVAMEMLRSGDYITPRRHFHHI
ncbi:MAG: hypothetical protein IPF83_06940 [Rhodanobacteraceae bacterium]|nr:hypothetical protein [Rhodanobacteraceae bacterium]